MSFVKGEIVIMQNAGYHTWFNGALGIVVDLLTLRSGLDKNTGNWVASWCYKVKVLAEGGFIVQADLQQLRKLPPFDIHSEYESCLKWWFEEKIKEK